MLGCIQTGRNARHSQDFATPSSHCSSQQPRQIGRALANRKACGTGSSRDYLGWGSSGHQSAIPSASWSATYGSHLSSTAAPHITCQPVPEVPQPLLASLGKVLGDCSMKWGGQLGKVSFHNLLHSFGPTHFVQTTVLSLEPSLILIRNIFWQLCCLIMKLKQLLLN